MKPVTNPDAYKDCLNIFNAERYHGYFYRLSPGSGCTRFLEHSNHGCAFSDGDWLMPGEQITLVAKESILTDNNQLAIIEPSSQYLGSGIVIQGYYRLTGRRFTPQFFIQNNSRCRRFELKPDLTIGLLYLYEEG